MLTSVFLVVKTRKTGLSKPCLTLLKNRKNTLQKPVNKKKSEKTPTL